MKTILDWSQFEKGVVQIIRDTLRGVRKSVTHTFFAFLNTVCNAFGREIFLSQSNIRPKKAFFLIHLIFQSNLCLKSVTYYLNGPKDNREWKKLKRRKRVKFLTFFTFYQNRFLYKKIKVHKSKGRTLFVVYV